MFFFKACSKCQGDIYLDRDSYGAYYKCLQCGRYFDLELPPPSLALQQSSLASEQMDTEQLPLAA